MLYIPDPTSKDLNEYFDLIKSQITNCVQKSPLNAAIKSYLTESKIKEIVTSRPLDLYQNHISIMQLLVAGFTQSEYLSYCSIKRKRKRTVQEQIIHNKYLIVDQLQFIFDYNKIIAGDKNVSYHIANKLNRNTCTYCNRLYTITVIEQKTGSRASSEQLTRPQFDHWFAKSIYPALSLSYFNLIPSCSVCNSSIKGDSNFTLGSHVHPYIHEASESFSFTYKYDKNIDQLEVSVKFKGKKSQSTLEAFKTLEIYNAHANLELRDLYDLRHKYSDNYLNILLNDTFSNLSISKTEVYRLIFGVEFDDDILYKRPFSKFKKDILIELGINI